MKPLLKTGLRIILLLLFVQVLFTPSCNLFEFRTKCNGTPEVAKDELIRSGTDWTDEQRNVFYSGIVNDTILFFWNTSIYQLACTMNPVTVKVRISVLNWPDFNPKYSMILTSDAEAQNIKEIQLQEVEGKDNTKRIREGNLEIDFNNPNSEYLYGSVNVQTRLTIPLPPNWVDNAANREYAIELMEDFVDAIWVDIHYTY